MAELPKIYQDLFQEDGAGDLLRKDILPTEAVTCDPQTFTEEQKTQIRQNIGAASGGIASATQLGLVKIGSGISIDTNGKISADSQLPDQTDKSGKYLKTDGTNASWGDVQAGASFPLLTAMWADHLLNDQSWLRADTFSWQSGTTYSNVYQHLVSDISGKSLTSETVGGVTVQFYLATDGHKVCPANQESKVSSIYTNTGVAWYYILDTSNTRFKLPRTKFGFTGYRDGVGNFVAAGLPNIEGKTSVAMTESMSELQKITTGAFNVPGTRSGNCPYSGNSTRVHLLFNAANSNAIYGASNTVQPKATQMYLYFYVGGFTQSATEQTAGLNAELFNGKVDINGSNAQFAHIIETYKNGSSGYRIWSDGYCEQWGYGGGKDVSVTLLKKYKDTNYGVTGSESSSNTGATRALNGYVIASSSTFKMYSCNGNNHWRAWGYLAEGEY